jgi:hypothetical protein
VTAATAVVARLGQVIAEALPDTPVIDPEDLADPEHPASAVVVRPLTLTRRARSHRDGGVLDLALTVLVMPVGADALEHLEQLLVELDRAVEFTVSLEPLPLELLQALGLPPRPLVVACADVPVPLGGQSAPVVREPLRADIGALRLVRGVVLGPGGVGLPDARVQVRGAEGWVRCGQDGGFRLPMVSPRSPLDVVVEVKGRSFATQVTVREGVPVVIRCDRWEGQ